MRLGNSIAECQFRKLEVEGAIPSRGLIINITAVHIYAAYFSTDSMRCFFDQESKLIPTPEKADGAAAPIVYYVKSLVRSSVPVNRLLAKISRRYEENGNQDRLDIITTVRYYGDLLRRKNSEINELTGAHLTRYFHSFLEKECEAHLSNYDAKDARSGFTLMFIDVNDMTGFNARNSYKAGNEALRRMGAVTRATLSCVEEGVAIYGQGDDLKFILHNVPPGGADAFALKLKKAIVDGVFPELGFSASVGFVSVPQVSLSAPLCEGYKVFFDRGRWHRATLDIDKLRDIARYAMDIGDAVLMAYTLSKICYCSMYLDKYVQPQIRTDSGPASVRVGAPLPTI